jgi:hypothetical protein
MSDDGLPPLLDRHWAESALAIGAVVIAAVSLWVAYDSERTNRELVASERQLVAANSWPYIQIYESDTASAQPRMSLNISNNGIGPAKLESFELFWNGVPQRGPRQLLLTCCAGADQTAAADIQSLDHALQLSTSSDEGIVLRAGQILPFLSVRRSEAAAGAWDALHAGYARDIVIRYCYCSAFDACWLNTVRFGERRRMNPPEVRACPRPQVSYDNLGD